MNGAQAQPVPQPAAAGAGAPLALELRHLRYFVALADAGSFTRAAEKIFIAQPTLSQQIRRLEEIVGTPLLQRRREGLQLTSAGRVLLDGSRNVLALADQEVSRTRQAAGLGRPRLRVVMPPGLPESLTVPAMARLQEAAAAADVDLAWLETALDAEFSLISTRRADAGLGWLTTGPQTVPAALEVMTVGEFEPEVWVPAAHTAARCGTISLEELAGLQVIHGPRRAPRHLRRLGHGHAGSRPALRVHRPAIPALASHDPGPGRGREPARRRLDRPGHRRTQPGLADPAISPGRHLRHGPGQPPAPSADRVRGPGVERRPAPAAAADALRHRRQPDRAGAPAAR